MILMVIDNDDINDDTIDDKVSDYNVYDNENGE